MLLLNLSGAKVTSTTKDGDCVLYLATFGVLSSKQPDVSVLEMLISAGKLFYILYFEICLI